MEASFQELTGALLQLALFSVIPLLWWLISTRAKENFFTWIGLKKPVPTGSAGKSIAVSTAVYLVYGALTTLLVSRYSGQITAAGSQYTGKGAAYIPAALIYGFIRTGLSEEIVFRGFLLKTIGRRFGFTAGNTVQALIFGLLHGVPFGLVTGDWLVTAALTLLPGALGFFQGWLNEKQFGGSILPGWILHGITNTLVACMSL